MIELDLSRALPVYKSKTETAWASIGALWVGDWFKSRVLDERYEPLTFHLPGGSYTPDFAYVLENGRLVFTECKGSKVQRNYRDARSKLRAAAELYPWFIWTQATQAGRGQWDFEEIKI